MLESFNPSAVLERHQRRVRTLEVTPELILGFLNVGDGVEQGGYLVECTRDQIPPDAKCVRACINDHGNIVLMIQSETFDLVDAGGYCEPLRPLYSKTTIAAKE